MANNQSEIKYLTPINVETKKKKLVSFYDAWPEEPPDWEARVKDVRSTYKDRCSVCESSSKELKIEFKDTSYRQKKIYELENLYLICSDCKKEKIREKRRKITEDRLKILKMSLTLKCYVEFDYQSEERYQPREIKEANCRHLFKVESICHVDRSQIEGLSLNLQRVNQRKFKNRSKKMFY